MSLCNIADTHGYSKTNRQGYKDRQGKMTECGTQSKAETGADSQTHRGKEREREGGGGGGGAAEGDGEREGGREREKESERQRETN